MKGFNMESIAKLGKMGLAVMNRNLPSILSGAAIAGVIATAWAAYKAAPEIKSALDGAKWDKSFENEKDEESADGNETAKVTDDVELTAWETFTAVAPHIWKPVACGVFTVGCIVGAQVLNTQRLTMLVGAYKLSEKKLKEYEEKAKELLGDKKATELHDAVAKDIAAQTPVNENMIIQTGKGNQLCYDTFSGRYFYSSTETIHKAESTLSKMLMCGESVRLNDLYYELGLDNIKCGDAFGWQLYGGEPLDIKLTYDERMVNDESKVVCILDYALTLDDRNFCGRLY